MMLLRSIRSTHVARLTVAWALLFAAVHAYWAFGGAAGMNGEPADTVGVQIYIGFITVIGLLGATVAHGLVPGSRGLLSHRALVLLARVGGAALLAGVAVGVSRWLADGSLNGDGAAGIVTTVYFLLGGLLYARLGWAITRRESPTCGPPMARGSELGRA